MAPGDAMQAGNPATARARRSRSFDRQGSPRLSSHGPKSVDYPHPRRPDDQAHSPLFQKKRPRPGPAGRGRLQQAEPLAGGGQARQGAPPEPGDVSRQQANRHPGLHRRKPAHHRHRVPRHRIGKGHDHRYPGGADPAAVYQGQMRRPPRRQSRLQLGADPGEIDDQEASGPKETAGLHHRPQPGRRPGHPLRHQPGPRGPGRGADRLYFRLAAGRRPALCPALQPHGAQHLSRAQPQRRYHHSPGFGLQARRSPEDLQQQGPVAEKGPERRQQSATTSWPATSRYWAASLSGKPLLSPGHARADLGLGSTRLPLPRQTW